MKPKIFNKYMWRYVDWFLLIIICVLVFFGMMSMINATAQPFTGDESSLADYMANLDLSFAQRQLMFFGIGVGALFAILLIDYTVVRKISDYIYWICIAFLVIVLFFGANQRGTSGWFMIGSYGVQPSEFAKLGIILAISKVVAVKTEGNEEGLTRFRDVFPALWRFLIPFALVVAQPDFGTALVYLAILIVILFMAKTSWKIFLVIAIVGVVAVILALNLDILQEYQRTRLYSFFDPASQDADSLLQVNQAKMAIGSGGITGKGLFAPGTLATLDYVPEKQNDFIFAVTVEAFGLVGGIVLVGLYFLLVARTIMLAMRAKDDFGAYIIMGVAAMALFHVVENVGMNIGILPVTGISLPFFSYGGSNMLTSMMAFGMVLSVDMRRTRWPIG